LAYDPVVNLEETSPGRDPRSGKALQPNLLASKALRLSGIAGFLVAGLAVLPGHAIFVEQQDYLPVPEAAQPLEGLLPTRGVEGTGGRGLLKVNTAYLKRSHNVNFETREFELV
jgi:hypothetical protein